ncbi:MAG: hypothetical protein CMD78_03105 [Gammaproteobacteria bacterium]|nr:hypothetical protein [Gammaproteobacteria bacterium]
MNKQKSLQKNESSSVTVGPQKKNASKTALWFVIVIILIFACGGLAWYGQQIVNSIKASVDQNNQKIETISQTINANGDQLASVVNSQENVKEMFKTQNFNLEQLRNRDIDLQENLMRLQNQINEVSTISSESDSYWLMNQAIYFLNIAKTELSLFGNKTSAQSALIAAQKSVLQMPDQYRKVDRSIQSALLKLDPEDYNNKKSEILISLQNIDNAIDSHVFNTFDAQQLAEKDNSLRNNRSVLENKWQKIVDAFKNLVVVRSNNDAENLKLNTTQKQITKKLISLQLEMAKLAILHNNDDEYQTSLSNCIELIDSNFRDSLPGVKNLIDQLIVLKNFELKQSIPEIDDALALLEEAYTS